MRYALALILTAFIAVESRGENELGTRAQRVAVTPEGMALIPAGHFVMGAATNVGQETYSDGEIPQHTANVSSFYIDKCEVSAELWSRIAKWAATNGYDDLAGGGKATNCPVDTVSWYDCVKWCNARSQMSGAAPCYTTSGVVYRTGIASNVVCDWAANGFRLPTEAEWEKAARGGVANTRFPWANYTNKISHAKANYYGNTANVFDLSAGAHARFKVGGAPFTSPVGYFSDSANGYGLYDMAGNVSEWCWDWYDLSYYTSSPSTDPRGPSSSAMSKRVNRGGCWSQNARSARIASRDGQAPTRESNILGVRCAKGL